MRGRGSHASTITPQHQAKRCKAVAGLRARHGTTAATSSSQVRSNSDGEGMRREGRVACEAALQVLKVGTAGVSSARPDAHLLPRAADRPGGSAPTAVGMQA